MRFTPLILTPPLTQPLNTSPNGEKPRPVLGGNISLNQKHNPEDSHAPAVDVILVIAAVKEVCHTLFTAEGTGEWLFIDEQTN